MFVNELNKKVCARRVQRPTNLFDWAMPSAANFRASECRAELVRAMPSAAENLKENVKKRCMNMNQFARTPGK